MNFPTACTLSVLFSFDLPLVCSNSPLFVKLSYFHLSHSYEMFPFFLSYSNKSGFILIFRFLAPQLILLPLSHTAVTRLQDLYPFLPAPEVAHFIIPASSSSGYGTLSLLLRCTTATFALKFRYVYVLS